MPVDTICTLHPVNQGVILIFKSYFFPCFFFNFTEAELIYNAVLAPVDSMVIYISRYRTYIHKQSFSDSFPLCVYVCTRSCPTFCSPMNCSPPGSSVHGISPYRLLQNIE